MSNNIYDILGKLNGLVPKENPVSTSEPIYESVDLRGDIIEAVTGLEKKYAAFNENIVAEKKKKKKKSAEKIKQPDAGDITSADATINQLLTKARFSRPGAKNDLEAMVYHIAKQDEELERAKAAEEEDRMLIKKAQAVTDQMNDRFKKLNAKVAAGQITTQDQAHAQAAQQIEKDTDAAKAAIAADPTAPIQQIADPEIKTQKAPAPAVSKTEPEANNIYNFPTKEPAPVQAVTPAPKLTNQPSPGLAIAKYQSGTTAGGGKVKATPQGYVHKRQSTSVKGSGVTGTKAPGIDDLEIAAESLTEESRYPEGTPEAGKYNWGLLARAWKNKLPYVDLNFGLKDVRMTDAQMYAALATWKSNGVDFSAGGDPTIDNVLSSRENLEIFFRGRKFKDFLSAYPKVKEKALKATQGAKPGVTARVNPNVPSGTQEDLPLAEQNLGNKTMTKPTSIIEAVRSVEYKKLKEAAKPDFLDLDKDGDTDEPMKSAAKSAKDHEPAKPDSDAVAKRKRLQALKDKQEDERAEKGDDDKSPSRFVKGRAYGGSAQKDDEDKDLDESGLQAYLGKKKYGKEGMKALQKAGREGAGKETMAKLRARHDKFDESAKPDYIDLDKDGDKKEPMKKAAKDAKQVDEVAPPGAKAERMVKHIKKGYAKDGNLSKKEKGIAYATAWKAKKAGKLEESRNAESSEYTYETIGRVLCDEQPHLDANSEAFVKAVYDELIEMKLTPKAARWLVNYDQDFLSDCATSYGHFCASKEKEAMECGAPMNSFVSEQPTIDAVQELDEIARLAGLTREDFNPMVPGDSASPLTYAGCSKCNADPCCCEDEKAMDEGMGCSEDELNEAATRKDFRMVADLLKSIPDMAKRTELAMYHADIFKQQNSRFKKEMFLAAAGVDVTPIKDVEDEVLVGEAEVGEGNEFTGALAAAKASGSKDFEVDGKKYTVKEDINVNVSANGEEDVVNLIRKLSGMPMIAIQAQPAEQSCDACGSSPCGCESLEEDGPTERDVEYTNTPREQVAGTDAAIPAGADLNRAKRQYKKEYPSDNPMAVKEAIQNMLWNDYQSMINDVKA